MKGCVSKCFSISVKFKPFQSLFAFFFSLFSLFSLFLFLSDATIFWESAWQLWKSHQCELDRTTGADLLHCQCSYNISLSQDIKQHGHFQGDFFIYKMIKGAVAVRRENHVQNSCSRCFATLPEKHVTFISRLVHLCVVSCDDRVWAVFSTIHQCDTVLSADPGIFLMTLRASGATNLMRKSE